MFSRPSPLIPLVFANRQTRVVERIVLVIGAIVRNPAYDVLWIVTSRKRAFRIGPVMLRLSQRARLRRSQRRVATRPEVGLCRVARQREMRLLHKHRY